jgi:diadenosine tetraphosphatase ApaH/serine/threonine PP2A family protein phosphatase
VPFLIVSDIHGNREALEAVLASAAGKHDRIICLGDLAGYGADPNFVIDWARANAAAVIRGNHDKVCAGLEPLYSYRPAARMAAEWSRDALTPANLEFLQRLPRGPLPYEGFDLVHGSPLDEDEYLLTLQDVEQVAGSIESWISFVGHTHVQGGFLIARGSVRQIDPAVTLELDEKYRYLVNPGSVGQPRDGDPRAAFAIYDAEARIVEFHRITYDVARAARKIEAAGLPTSLAERLFTGV